MAKKKIRPEFEAMLNDVGCPECKSVETYETTADVSSKGEVDVCICDDCGHVELKFDV